LGVLARYREHLPITERTPMVDLNEGSTPLVESRNIGPALGLKRLLFKYEGLNPTGSFKDRGMVVAVAKALEVLTGLGYTPAEGKAAVRQATVGNGGSHSVEQLVTVALKGLDRG